MLSKFIDRARENSLTASIFSHLLHLPSEVFWKILRNACCHPHSLPESPGEVELEAWPHWNPSGTGRSSYVEPDLFLRFARFDLIVEAKYGDSGGRNFDQWERELRAYTNEYGDERREVRMLALGGIHQQEDDRIVHTWLAPADEDGRQTEGFHEFICPVHMCLWSRLLTQCQRMERELGKLGFPTSQTHAHRRILVDLIQFFAFHGYQTGIWYEETLSHRPRLSANTESAHAAFVFIHTQVQPA